MLRKLFMVAFMSVLAVCALSDSAKAATTLTGFYTATVDGTITSYNGAMSNVQYVTIRESNLPANAVVTKVVFKSGGITGSGVITTNAYLHTPNGQVINKSWSGTTGATFTASDFRSTEYVKGKWGVAYSGQGIAGSKGHTKLTLEFTYTYTI